MLLLWNGDCKPNNHDLVCFFSCLISSACFCSFEVSRWQKGATRDLILISRWKSYLIHGEQPVNILMVAPFHWLLCCLTQHQRKTHRLSRKKMKCSKKVHFWRQKNFNCEFLYFPPFFEKQEENIMSCTT